MAKPANNSTVFLEDWLKSIAGYDNNGSSVANTLNPPKNSLASSPARAIIQAWSDLRDSVKNQSFDSHHLRSLNSLVTLQAYLHVADPQAKLVLSILSSKNLSLPSESHPLLLRLLYVWLRKSARPLPSLVGSALEAISRLVASSLFDARLFSEAVLLLGSVAFASSAPETARLSLDLMSGVLERNYRLMGLFEGIFPNVLAGIGYALSSVSPGDSNYVRVLDFLLGVWGREGGPRGSVAHGLAILHLVEWVATRLIATSSVETVAFFSREAFEAAERKGFAPFAAIMGTAGALRALNKSAQRSELFSKLRVSAEERLESVARSLIRDRSDGLSLRCFALGMARCGPVSPRPDFLVALASALLTEIFPMRRLYLQAFDTSETETHAREHVESVLFKEAGAVASIFCNQYTLVKDEESRAAVESLVWNYCRFVYTEHRKVALAIRVGKKEESLLLDIEKVAESAFLMVVVFALTVTKQKLNLNSSGEIRARISREVLVAFSALEYFRRIRLPEYLDTIREVVMCIQENDSACASFVESIPSYADLVNGPDFGSERKSKYVWYKDEVQTARLLFYLRVIATCVDHVPGPLIEKVVAPMMFLYLGHPNEKISRASHSMFAAFVSSKKDSDRGETASLKEQLVFYYMERSLMGYPGITPIDGLASGVYALVPYLPAGSPAIFYCVHCLVEKANSLCREDSAQKADTWKNWQGDSEPFKKLLDLLLRLTSLVDVQVLPELMKLMAQLIVKLPKDGQVMVLNELYSMVAESDDVTRKPTLVSWLQSLSYLCFQKDSDARKKRIASNQNKDRERNSVFNARL